MSKKEFMSKLIAVQTELRAPKNIVNNFGNFNYRSCEDILAVLKPLLAERGLFQTLSDDVEVIGDRYYIKATVSVTDGEFTHSVSAYAREAPSKPKFDDAQLTGSASSYARKYALSGFYNIDDTKDIDSYSNAEKQPYNKPNQYNQPSKYQKPNKQYSERDNKRMKLGYPPEGNYSNNPPANHQNSQNALHKIKIPMANSADEASNILVKAINYLIKSDDKQKIAETRNRSKDLLVKFQHESDLVNILSNDAIAYLDNRYQFEDMSLLSDAKNEKEANSIFVNSVIAAKDLKQQSERLESYKAKVLPKLKGYDYHTRLLISVFSEARKQ